MHSKTKGNILALVSSVFQATVLIFWVYLLKNVSKPMVMIYWGGLAAVLLFFYLLLSKKLTLRLDQKQVLYLTIIGLTSALTAYLLLVSAEIVGAAITAFLMVTSVIFSLIFSVFFLDDTFTKRELGGIVLLGAALFLLNWKASIEITLSSGIVLLGALSQSVSDMFAKKSVKAIGRVQVNMIRTFFIAMMGFIILFAGSSSLQLLSAWGFGMLTLGVILGPILTFFFYYFALEKTNLVTAMALKNTNPMFTLLFAFLFLGETINMKQGLSFGIILVGAYLILTHMKDGT